MQDAQPKHGPSRQTRPKKDRKKEILELFRIELKIPDSIPRGGLELCQYLKKCGPARLKMAIDTIRLACPEISKSFTNQTLSRWAKGNKKIHKSSLIQSPESEESILKELTLRRSQGMSIRSLQHEIVGMLPNKIQKEKVSKSTVDRLLRKSKKLNPQEPCKKVKPNTDSSSRDLSTQISPSIENLNFSDNGNQLLETPVTPISLGDLEPIRFTDKSRELLFREFKECLDEVMLTLEMLTKGT